MIRPHRRRSEDRMVLSQPDRKARQEEVDRAYQRLHRVTVAGNLSKGGERDCHGMLVSTVFAARLSHAMNANREGVYIRFFIGRIFCVSTQLALLFFIEIKAIIVFDLICRCNAYANRKFIAMLKARHEKCLRDEKFAPSYCDNILVSLAASTSRFLCSA